MALAFNLDDPSRCVKYLFTKSGDAAGYIEPVKNLVDKGVYYEYNSEKGIFMYASRAPGMLPVLGPLYYLFGIEWALALLALIQYVLDALCCVLLAKIALKLFKNERAFYCVFFVYAFSSIVSVTSHYGTSEFLCTSFGILAFYFVIFAKNSRHYFISGLFATWAFFFRPTAVLLFVFVPLFFAVNNEGKISFSQFLQKKTALLFMLLPFVFFESLWIGRNYRIMNRLIATNINLENFGNPAVWSVFNTIMDVGGDLQSWNPDSEMRWFNNKTSGPDYDSLYAKTNPFPSYVFKADITYQDFKDLRQKFQDYSSNKPDSKYREQEIDSLARSISSRFKQNTPWHYHVSARLRVLKTLVFIKRPYGVTFNKNGKMEKILRGWNFLSYYITLALFMAGVLFVLKSRNKGLLIILAFTLLHIIMLGAIIRVSENRYLIPIQPFEILTGTAFLLYLFPGSGTKAEPKA